MQETPWLGLTQVFGGNDKDGKAVKSLVRLPDVAGGVGKYQQAVEREGGACLLVDDSEVSPRRSVSWEEFSLWYLDNHHDVKR